LAKRENLRFENTRLPAVLFPHQAGIQMLDNERGDKTLPPNPKSSLRFGLLMLLEEDAQVARKTVKVVH